MWDESVSLPTTEVLFERSMKALWLRCVPSWLLFLYEQFFFFAARLAHVGGSCHLGAGQNVARHGDALVRILFACDDVAKPDQHDEQCGPCRARHSP